MGNKLCCDENRDTNNVTGEPEKSQSLEGNKIFHSIYDNNDENADNNDNIDNNMKNKNSKENFLENLKSSIFDDENENHNNTNKLNYEEQIIDNKYKYITSKAKNNVDINKSGNNSYATDKNILKIKKNYTEIKNKKKEIRKEKSHFNQSHDDKKLIIKNSKSNYPNYNNSHLDLNELNNDKENDFYLINTSQYIGLKNSNNNLVFIKNNKDININQYELIPLINNKEIIEIDNNNKNKNSGNIIKTNNNTQKTTSMNQNIVITAKSHNIPYGEKLSDKNYTNSSAKEISNKNLLDFINKYNVVENLHHNDYKIIETYIKNQIRKIINAYKNHKKNSNSNFINNYEIKFKNFNKFDRKIDDTSYDILNTGTCQTIMNKDKNFCIKYFDNGSIYIGEIKNNKCNGHGKYIGIKGDTTIGFFRDNFLDGYEIISRKRNNSLFEGEIEKNKFNGYGIEIFEDHSTYYGKFENNEKSGIGTYDWGDGSQYQGLWKNSMPNGLGIFTDNKNRLYEGEWKNGKMNGIGFFKWDDGRKYIGYFNEDKREGFGIFFWPKPLKIYLGFWHNGLQNGVGKIYTSFKDKYYLWQEGKIIQKLSNKKEIEESYNILIRQYSYYFKMTTDDLLTLMLDL